MTDDNTLDVDHILLGVLQTEHALGRRVLDAMHADTQRLHDALQGPFGPPATQERPSQTNLAKRVIHLAIQEAQAMGHEHVGTEHLLLGLLRVRRIPLPLGWLGGGRKSPAWRLLRDSGVTLANTRLQVRQTLGPSIQREPYWNGGAGTLE